MDERLPKRNSQFPERFLTIIEGSKQPHNELFYSDNVFRSDFGKVTHWLEEQTNVIVLSDKQEIRDFLYDFIKHYQEFYKNGNPYKHVPVNDELECIEEFLEEISNKKD